jgi:hypothetical protein
MCTVSLIARDHGYALAMNRDEKLSRVAGLPPKLRGKAGRKILGPSEPGGGTWIALNNAGITFALINWYAITTRVKINPVSRGDVVNAVSATVSPPAASAVLKTLPLRQMNPFRLIGVFPATQEIFQWRWNLKKLIRKKHPWATQQWISSGFDEPTAQRIRSETFRRALKQKSVGGLDWLRRLHRSHAPCAGPFATCMHRADAATVSYTETVIAGNTASLRHQNIAPCAAERTFQQALKLNR